MVYLLKSPYSKNQPDDWVCGGVLVSTIHVLTSASCLTEFNFMYVIAGYKKYISGINVDVDECTRTRKQKIVKILIPKAYSTSRRVQYNVGIGVTEKPYNFFDVSYRKVCSYEPEAISINYSRNMEVAHKSVLILGWGEAKPSKSKMSTGAISGYLMVARTVITSRSFCRSIFAKNMTGFILCVHGFNGVVNIEDGVTTSFETKTPNVNTIDILRNCDDEQINTNDSYAKCLESAELSLRRKFLIGKDSNSSFVLINEKPKVKNILKNNTKSHIRQRNNRGICQNNRGGPLVAFAGHHPLVIGVGLSSAFNKKYQCDGPYFYLSTARTSDLIKCLLSYDKNTNKQCQLMQYEVKEYSVNWPGVQGAVKTKGVQAGFRFGRENVTETEIIDGFMI